MHRKGFSLASLLLLTAVVAIFLAGICTVWMPPERVQADPDAYDMYEEPNLDEAVMALSILGGLLVGSIVGLVIGANQVRPVPGVFLGTFVGMVIGAATGVLLAVPGKTLPVAAGSLLVVLFGAVVRRYSGRPPK